MNETYDLEILRNAIEAKGLKVKYLAKKIGVIPGTLSSFLTGKRGLGGAALKSLLRELDLNMETLRKKAS